MGRRPTITEDINDFRSRLAEAHADQKAAEVQVVANALAATFEGATLKQYAYRYRVAAREILGDDHPALAALDTKQLRKKGDEVEVPARGANAAPSPPAADHEKLAGRALEGAPGPAKDSTPAAAKVSRAELNAAGRRPKLQNAIATFTAKVSAAESEEQVVDLWARELNKYSHLTDTTRLTYVTKYRDDIRKTHGDDCDLLRLVVAPTDLTNSVTSARNAAILSEHRALIGIRHWRKIIQRATTLLASNDPLDIGIGLVVLTGRRPVEIFVSGVFERHPLPGGQLGAYEKWQVLFAGQAKTRGKEGTRFGEAYPIPVLAPARQIIEAWERLRVHPNAESRLSVATTDGNVNYETIRWSEMTAEEFSRALRISLRDRVTLLYADLWPPEEPVAPYRFRSLYVQVAYRVFCSQSVSLPSYICKILGHANEGGKGLETAHAYMDYYLIDGEDDVLPPPSVRLRRTKNRERIAARLTEIGKLPQISDAQDAFEADEVESVEGVALRKRADTSELPRPGPDDLTRTALARTLGIRGHHPAITAIWATIEAQKKLGVKQASVDVGGRPVSWFLMRTANGQTVPHIHASSLPAFRALLESQPRQ
ncbi:MULTISPECIES: protelomerase family protein [unclassified Xanthobacter]|uniref:protelomerase family protein n=1 Tax=unclassified Xanthobacter TaxID=2623496 RepID=UPI001F3AAB32|nr:MULTISPECIES: protelomerase family protein [unclassified Xanthobacter]